MQTAIPCLQIRGGTSKGLFFNATDLPADPVERNRLVLAAMEGAGIGDPRQIDGLGGANSLTSKAAIISPSEQEDADVDYFFMQIMIGKGKISEAQTCGNILAGVAVFAIETGMVAAGEQTTSVRVNILNTGGICEVVVQTPGGQVEYAGNAKIDGVPGTAAPIFCNYLGTAGATCGALLPTGNLRDEILGKPATLIDNGMPLVVLRATDFGISGQENKAELDANETLKSELEKIRLEAGLRMRLGDVTDQSIPKMCLLSEAVQGGFANTRMFIPHVCHDAIGVLAAVSAATCCVLPGTVAEGIATAPEAGQAVFSIEHPTGELTVNLETERDREGSLLIKKSGVVRTARLLGKGVVYVPMQLRAGGVLADEMTQPLSP